MNRSENYSEKQKDQIEKFQKKHEGCTKPDKSINRDRFTYMETPCGGIGPQDEIRCNNCGEIEDFTDVDCW
jgi:hypothetical protein